ncbi:PREDICTED: tumor necrosis factor receptor superfamily member 6B isoform X1 [Gavialis gangeticus]|uniref:tumor necrosis factor receptor superfamily member 6B isoform X1 n=1 Tax=Gavialis gangeticus TaxID=94835 RepID=UPI00092F0F41|nr:PREDICTED: tumor necrosis factor receptor superfamily member 6B isoform X1 [Gavialis gangeticus]
MRLSVSSSLLCLSLLPSMQCCLPGEANLRSSPKPPETSLMATTSVTAAAATLSAMQALCTLEASHLSMWMFGLLLSLTVLGSSSAPTYPWRDPMTRERIMCQQCPPGTFVAQHCTKDRQTVCKPCPELHYTQYWNYLDECRYCNIICGEQEVEVHQCNATHNRVCQCQEGYYSNSEFCIRHSECPLGHGVVKPGTPFMNTKCEECPPGFFSDVSSSTKPCQEHQNCQQQGKLTNVPGNQFHDTRCTTCGMAKGNGTQEAGKEDCKQAVIDFVVYQNIPMRKLKRLQQFLEQHSTRKYSQGNRAAIQEKFRAYLLQLKEDHLELTKELLIALRAVKLHEIEEEVRKRFNLVSEN